MFSIFMALAKICDVIILLILIQCVMSWIPTRGENFYKIYNAIDSLTGFIMAPIRNVMYRFVSGPVDFSPLIATFILIFIKRILINIALGIMV